MVVGTFGSGLYQVAVLALGYLDNTMTFDIAFGSRKIEPDAARVFPALDIRCNLRVRKQPSLNQP